MQLAEAAGRDVYHDFVGCLRDEWWCWGGLDRVVAKSKKQDRLIIANAQERGLVMQRKKK